MLIRPRRSRIYYLRKFFDYPITLTTNTLKNLGVLRMVRVGTSYAASRVSQIKPENLEDLIEQLNDLSVDVDQKDEATKVRVKVFCE